MSEAVPAGDALAQPAFRRLWLAHGVSTFGSLVTRAALPFTAVLALQASASQMALLAAVNLLSGAVVAPLAGPWLERAHKRRAMIGADAARALVLALVPLAAALGRLDFTVLVLVQAAEGAWTSVFDIAQRSWLPALVGPGALGRANARLASTDSVAEISAFGLSGWLVQWLGGPLAIALDALSYVISGVALFGIRADAPPPPPPGRPARGGAGEALREVGAGLRAAFADPALRALACAEASVFLMFGMFMSCYMLYAARELALPPGTLGMVFGLGGVSTLAVSLALPALTARWGPRRAMMAGIACGFAGLLLALAGSAAHPVRSLVLLSAQQLVADGGWVVFLVTAETLRMTLAAESVRARVAAGARTLMLLARLAGTAAAAALASRTSARMALAVGATLVLPAFVALARLRLPEGVARASSDT